LEFKFGLKRIITSQFLDWSSIIFNENEIASGQLIIYVASTILCVHEMEIGFS